MANRDQTMKPSRMPTAIPTHICRSWSFTT
jgi:hypothetical protein